MGDLTPDTGQEDRTVWTRHGDSRQEMRRDETSRDKTRQAGALAVDVGIGGAGRRSRNVFTEELLLGKISTFKIYSTWKSFDFKSFK